MCLLELLSLGRLDVVSLGICLLYFACESCDLFVKAGYLLQCLIALNLVVFDLLLEIFEILGVDAIVSLEHILVTLLPAVAILLNSLEVAYIELELALKFSYANLQGFQLSLKIFQRLGLLSK